jgi:hypothetical protein
MTSSSSNSQQGHAHIEGLHLDPGIERWSIMRATSHAYYRFNARKIIPTFVTLVAIPGLMMYGMLQSFV